MVLAFKIILFLKRKRRRPPEIWQLHFVFRRAYT
jgi:hypothetical protein